MISRTGALRFALRYRYEPLNYKKRYSSNARLATEWWRVIENRVCRQTLVGACACKRYHI